MPTEYRRAQPLSPRTACRLVPGMVAELDSLEGGPAAQRRGDGAESTGARAEQAAVLRDLEASIDEDNTPRRTFFAPDMAWATLRAGWR